MGGGGVGLRLHTSLCGRSSGTLWGGGVGLRLHTSLCGRSSGTLCVCVCVGGGGGSAYVYIQGVSLHVMKTFLILENVSTCSWTTGHFGVRGRVLDPPPPPTSGSSR